MDTVLLYICVLCSETLDTLQIYGYHPSGKYIPFHSTIRKAVNRLQLGKIPVKFKLSVKLKYKRRPNLRPALKNIVYVGIDIAKLKK